MKRITFILLLLTTVSIASAQPADTLSTQPHKPWLKRLFDNVYEIVKDFDRTDSNYIESQRYNYTVMMQGTHTYERYTLSSKSGQEFTFAPSPTVKLGPYVGWRWIFLGYQIDLNHLNNKTRTELDLSIYSSLIGVDLFYRKTGSEYHVKSAYIGNNDYSRQLEGVPFNGIQVGISGFNLYYILNHRRFSYPAAFSQSTIQRRSAGSPLIGIGYTRHHIKLDSERLREVVREHTNDEVELSQSFDFKEIYYTDFAISAGYGYNYAFAHNWLLAASLSAALGYKKAKGENEDGLYSFYGFNFKNINIDGIGRFGLVYNNMRWYAGSSVILHTYNYNKSQFSTNNTFGNFNVYVGYNFGKRHRDHKKRKNK